MELRAIGHSVSLMGADDGAGGVGLGRIGRFHGTPIPARTAPLFDAVRLADVVHVLGFRDPVGTITALEARRRRIPLVLEPVGMHRRRLRSIVLKRAYDETLGRVVIEAASRVVASSHLEADELVRGGISRDKISIRPNGARFNEMRSQQRGGPFRAELGIPAAVPLVVTIARINMKKGLDVLARALSQLPGVWGLIAGPDEGDGTLERLLHLRGALGLGGRLIVRSEGLWGERKATALSEADCFCMPSLFENFGTAAIEAAGVGVPVVTTTECGVAEWLDPGSSRVVAPANAAALSKAIADVLGSRSFRDGAIDSAARIRSELNWSRLASQQVAIYEEAAGSL